MRLTLLPKDFISIHIRYTDKKIFVASYNWDCIQYVKTIFGEENVFNFSYIPKELSGKPIHENNYNLNKEKFVLDCLCDFFILCISKEYYYTCKDSGYSKNVEIVRKSGMFTTYSNL